MASSEFVLEEGDELNAIVAPDAISEFAQRFPQRMPRTKATVYVFILIVGGGKVGSYLTRALLLQGHEVVVIEKDERKAKMLDRLIDRQVTVVGDGCDPLVLEAAGVSRADVVVADTGDDEDNLVVVLLAKRKSKARCIARVNNPANKLIFELARRRGSGDRDLVDRTDPRRLNEQVNASKYRSMLETMHLFGKGDMQLVKLEIPPSNRRSTTNALPKSTSRTTPSSSQSTGPMPISRSQPATPPSTPATR